MGGTRIKGDSPGLPARRARVSSGVPLHISSRMHLDTEQLHGVPPCIADIFITNGHVAFPMKGRVANMYLSGAYVVPKGWRLQKRIMFVKWLWLEHKGCWMKQAYHDKLKERDHGEQLAHV